MIYELQILRGLAALLVVMAHYGPYLADGENRRWFEHGYVGVDVFFFVSGFVMYYITQADRDAKAFLIRRVFRIVPAAWVTTLIAYLLLRPDAELLVKSLLFIPLQEEPAPYFGFSLDSVQWTLSYEVWFYIAMCLALRLFPERRGLACAVIVIGSSFVLQALTRRVTLDPYAAAVPHTLLPMQVLGVIGNPLSLEFVAGLGLGAMFMRGAFDLPNRRLWALLAAAVFLGVLLGDWPAPGFGVYHKGGAGISLVLAVLLAGDSVRRWARPILPLGTISYSIYLVHQLAPFALKPPYEPRFFALFVAISAIAAPALYICVERPSQQIGRRLSRWRTAAVQPMLSEQPEGGMRGEQLPNAFGEPLNPTRP